MKFRNTILYVESVRETITFYQNAFGFDVGFIHEAGDYGELSTGETKLAFSSLSLMSEMGKSPGNVNPKHPVFELAFETDDVKSALTSALKAGASLVQDVTDMPWGQTLCYVQDPDGFLVEICSPVN